MTPRSYGTEFQNCLRQLIHKTQFIPRIPKIYIKKKTKIPKLPKIPKMSEIPKIRITPKITKKYKQKILKIQKKILNGVVAFHTIIYIVRDNRLENSWELVLETFGIPVFDVDGCTRCGRRSEG